LGSGAGGGIPQWNSASPPCVLAREGRIPSRSQAALAVSADGERWVLVNAAPDLRQQIAATPALHPRSGTIRNSPIAAMVLTGGEIDTIAGLLTLRERQAFALYAAPPVLDVLAANQVFAALDSGLVPRRAMAPGEVTAIADAAGVTLGLRIEAFAVPGKIPLFAETAGADPGRAEDGETVGLAISAPGAGTLVYIPGCAAVDAALRDRIAGAALLMFDGTLYRDDEMILAGAGAKTGARMGHMSLDGAAGTLAALRGCAPARRVLIHINNTNPILLPGSAERRHVEAEGWIVAEDGMEFTL
ncbi:MAG: pyrroloquinoline quinone biosynthesis protein PqqB, partial [Pseudomonadota bacterium]